MKKSLLFAVLYSVFGLIFPSLLFSQDIHVNCATVNPCTLTPAGGIQWSTVSPTWIFAPQNPAASILIYVHNNNTTSAHTATVKVFQTGFARTTAPTLTANADLWVQDAVTLNSTASASCNSVAANAPGTPGASGVGTCYVVSMYAAQVAIQITGTSVQAGSPDTYDLTIVQQSGYISGPQPGADSSAGDSTILAGTAFSSTALSMRSFLCNVLGAQTPCNFVVVPASVTSTNAPIRNVDVTTAMASGAGIPAAGVVASADNTSFSFLRMLSAFWLTQTINSGNLMVEKGPRWSVTSNPASGTTASASKAAGAAGVRHVVDCYSFSSDASGAVAATESAFVIRDGASGAGTIIWTMQDAIAAAAGVGIQTQGPSQLCGLNLVGSAATALTCEFTAGVANNHQSVSCSGFDVQ